MDFGGVSDDDDCLRMMIKARLPPSPEDKRAGAARAEIPRAGD